MIPYSQIENKLEDRTDYGAVVGTLDKDSDVDTVKSKNEGYAGIVRKDKWRDMERRSDERTFYGEIEGEKVAVKNFGAHSLKRLLSEFKTLRCTAINEYRKLEAARKLGLDVSEPLAITDYQGVRQLVKNAGDPSDGEVPFWLTDIGRISSSYDDSQIESHLNSCLKETLRQLSTLKDKGLVHRSMTPISHSGRDEFSVYGSKNLIRKFGEEVNITPTGELKDFEHVQKVRFKRLRKSDWFADPVAETVLSYIWTAQKAGFGAEEASSMVHQAIDEVSEKDGNIYSPRKSSLKKLHEQVSLYRNREQHDQFYQRCMESVPLREVAIQVTHDDKISSPSQYSMDREY